ncbi:uncharacterized protein C8Q71DRAFT_723788 [Rhodofomes roseus]|uniref:Uncharacterized protein n=1 Tax=Rhodofomes roseus TaxID=34475 RepID=A0ABQ8KFW1_9APHY|nr:uncharacterized protein C8Q71DRAFT_723788 [Rhodofomes roseus]KAH9836669.1 hypothetical protein C8Q71DRAFT_723788 [Rhodofomes roseus]
MPSTTWLSRSHWDALSPIRQLQHASSSKSARVLGASTLSSTTAPRGYPTPPSATPRDSPALVAPTAPVRRPVGTARSPERPSAWNARPSALDHPVDSRSDPPQPPQPLSHPAACSTRQPRCEDERWLRSPRSQQALAHAASEDHRAGARSRREDDRPPRSATRNETAHAHAQRDAASTREVSPRRYEEARTRAFHSEREREAAAQTARTNLPGHRTGAPRAASTNHRGGPQEELPGEESAGRTAERRHGGASREASVSTTHIYLPPPLSSPPAPRARPARPLSLDPRVPVERARRPLPSPAPPAHRARTPPADTIHPTHGPRVGAPSSDALLRSRRPVDDASPSCGVAPAPASHARPLALEAPPPELPPTSGALSPRSHARVVVRAHHEHEALAAEAAWRARLASYLTEPTAVVQVTPTRLYGAASLASALLHDTRTLVERARVLPDDVPLPTRDPRADALSSRGLAAPASASLPRHSSNKRAPIEHAHDAPPPKPPTRTLSPCSQGRADVHAYFAAQAQAFEQRQRERALAQHDNSPARPFPLNAPLPERPSADDALSPRSRARVEVRAHHERKNQAAEAAWRAHQARWSPDRWPNTPVPPTTALPRAHRAPVPPADAPQPTRNPRTGAPSFRGPTTAPTMHAPRERDVPASRSSARLAATSRPGSSTTRETSISSALREGCRAVPAQHALGSLSLSPTSARKGEQAHTYALSLDVSGSTSTRRPAPAIDAHAPSKHAHHPPAPTRSCSRPSLHSLSNGVQTAASNRPARMCTLPPIDCGDERSFRSPHGRPAPTDATREDLCARAQREVAQPSGEASRETRSSGAPRQNRPNDNTTPREHWPAPARTGQEFEASLRSVQASTSIHPSSALPVASTNRHDGLRGRHSPPSPSMPGMLDACPPSACSPSVSTDMRSSAPSQAISLPADTESSGLPPQCENLARFWSSFLRKPQALASV